MSAGQKNAFVSAANALALLYKQGIEDSKKAHSEGTRTALEKVIRWTMRNTSMNRTVSVDELMAFLKNELREASDPDTMDDQGQSGVSLGFSTSDVSAPAPAFPAFTVPSGSFQFSQPAAQTSFAGRKRQFDMDDGLSTAFEHVLNCSLSKRNHFTFEEQ